ncbi:MAG: prepilin-type N-terminal cleavage/methylation domain-containing protein [Candidatus Hydrogenedentes bacterium]|nr:prepilin-type N-terminal cleavage/methylation domain-containing protein [Candidatus Hydrogenedentota bacterium]
MKTVCPVGFTLIELLTVIAIIAILAALTATVVPGVLKRAKMADVSGDFNQLRTAMDEYYSKFNTYPPAPLCRQRTAAGIFQDTLHYMTLLELGAVTNLYDKFGPTGNEPYGYAPVNVEQFNRVKKFYLNQSPPDWNAAGSLAPLNLTVPTKYDAYVLLSVAPGSTDFHGIIPVPLAGEPTEQTMLRAFFLATRDQNNNGVLDFDYIARSQKGEKVGPLPDGQNVYGPIIFKHGT